MWWAIWCVMVVVSSAASAAPAPDSAPMDLVQIDSAGPDDESLGYAVSSLEGRYGAEAPWLYLLAEMPRDSQIGRAAVKRRMPSLSIDLPMSVLRQKLSLEKERKVHALRAAANRNFLNDIGKRGLQWSRSEQPSAYY
ncbi:hypothetical protein O3G_MSEX012186 [Manduca sexta]|nr:hypothetical protein O3G_MSEX012186 [Manduca sexta]